MSGFLKNVSLFEGLSDDDFERLAGMAEEVRLGKGDLLFAEGSAADSAYVIERGAVEIIKRSGDRDVLLAIRGPGDVIGEMALLDETSRMAGVRAREEAVLHAIGQEQLRTLLESSTSAATAMFRTVLGRWRTTEAMLRQNERMAQLGTLTAGLAHEMNNPAAAVQRGSGQLVEALEAWQEAASRAAALDLAPEQREELRRLEASAREHGASPLVMDSMGRSDRESELEEWLSGHGCELDAWELGPGLVDMNLGETDLVAIEETFGKTALSDVFGLLHKSYNVHNLLTEVGQGAQRISEIVAALKSYSYLDQAPIQAVDLHKGLDDTLLILRSKLRLGISVHKVYASDLPMIQGYGSELNQVWTNIIDNAADALDAAGTLSIRTRRDGDWAVVEIEDDGPGIPDEIVERIFDSFFTTKPPGKGTGLGLDISYNIVASKHRGDLSVRSKPGQTVFEIRLPINFEPV